jgi:hypothetical protein
MEGKKLLWEKRVIFEVPAKMLFWNGLWLLREERMELG